MGNVGFPELLVIAVVGLLVFGPRRLPEMARNAGRALNEFKRVTGELTEELKAGLDEPPVRPLPPVVSSDSSGVTGTEMLPMDDLLGLDGNARGGGSSVREEWKDPPPGKDV